MAKDSHSQSRPSAIIEFTLPGFTLFAIVLVLAGGALALAVIQIQSNRQISQAVPGFSHRTSAEDSTGRVTARDIPAWGEFIVHDIEVERPEEYAAAELNSTRKPLWTFEQKTPDKVRELLSSCGLSAAQVSHALAAERVLVEGNKTSIQPDDELVYGLSGKSRAMLYLELGRWPANHYMEYPYTFPGTNFTGWFESSNVSGDVVDKIKRLLYRRGEVDCFSDFETVVRGIPSERERLWLVKALSRQRALLVRVRIRPDTDIDKMIGYWDRGVQVKNVRPLLESVKRLPDGGTISLLYLLPHFARDRLYTFPTPQKPNDPIQDCHWTSMNFFNDFPDDRFSQVAFTAAHLRTNFYPVAKATEYGDVVMFLNERGDGIHSAVYLADDIVFTKNGNNYAQPWTLMRLKDLAANFSPLTSIKVAVYRNKAW